MLRFRQNDGISLETVRRRLAENALKPWREKMWCVPKIDGAYVARMEDVLDLRGQAGAEPPDPKYPVVCLDESPVQLIGEVREPLAAAPGQLARVDYEDRRCGTVNLFVAVDAHRSWRKVSVTERRTEQDYAERLRALVDVDYRDATCIRVVQDNLSTHTPGALYEAFPAPERIASWSGSSSTTRPSTRVGSTWSRSKSECSRASAWTGASTTAWSSSARSPPGSAGATPPAHA